LVDPSHDKRVHDCQKRADAIVSSMEALREKIVADCQAFFPTWYKQEVGKIVQMSPEIAQAAGREKLICLRDEVHALAGTADEIVGQTIAADSVWIHRARNPEQSKLDEIATLSHTEGDPTRRWLSEAVQVAAGRILPVTEKYGFQVAFQPQGYRPAMDSTTPRPYPYRVSLPETIVSAARSYVQTAYEFRSALRDLTAAKQAKLRAEAGALWDKGDRMAEPQQWEYKCVEVHPALESKYAGDAQSLNELGSVGWELVEVVPRGEANLYGYFKRPRPQRSLQGNTPIP
jgi:hypothetical protein